MVQVACGMEPVVREFDALALVHLSPPQSTEPRYHKVFSSNSKTGISLISIVGSPLKAIPFPGREIHYHMIAKTPIYSKVGVLNGPCEQRVYFCEHEQ